MIHSQAIVEWIQAQNLSNSVICLHSSFKSLGPVDGGPAAFINAFIQAGCTLLCPAFYYQDDSFNDLPQQIDPSMGLIPRTLVADQRSIRSRNPHDSFVALGPYARELLQDNSLLNVYAAYKRLYHSQIKASVVLLGVGLDACTPIHYAEELAGRKLFHRMAMYHNTTLEIEVGSCSDGFENLSSALSSLEATAYLGQSMVRLYDFRPFIYQLSEHIRQNPYSTVCSDPNCERCQKMLIGGGQLLS